MTERLDTKEEFSVVKRAKSFSHAGRGVWVFVKTTHNAWIHFVVFAMVIAAGLYLRISVTDWVLLVFAAALVVVAEAFNTAIEIDIDLTSSEYHPYARDTKDVAAGAVLIAALAAVVVGVLVLAPYIFG